MKSRISFFNSTALRKDISRFAPLWGLYTVFTLMVVFLLWNNDNTPTRFANNAADIMQAMGLVNFAYGGLCALLLFGDLFSSRLCNALHAMPLRREGWFLVHLSAGLLFCLVPNLLATLICILLLQQHYWIALVWLGLMVLQFLFFFGVGAFACVSAGNRLGAAAIYAMINFLAVIAAWLVMTFYEPFLYGIELDLEAFALTSPVVRFAGSQYVWTEYSKIPTELIFKGFIQEDWRFAYIAAAVGAAFMALSVPVYRLRKLESAGDMISLPLMRPVVLIAYTLCAGAAMYFISDIMAEAGRYVFLILGLTIGFFTGRMLLERKVNVFRRKTFLVFAAFLAAFGVTVGLTWLDPLGVTRYVPKAEQVASVSISPYNNYHYLYDDARLKLTEQEDIETITALHRDVVVNRRLKADSVVYIHYELENGQELDRKYYIDPFTKNGQTLRNYYSSMEFLLDGYDLDTLLKCAYALEFYSYQEDVPTLAVGVSEVYMDPGAYREKYGEQQTLTYLTKDLPDGATAQGLDVQIVRGLFDAIRADCQLGLMAQGWDYHPNHDNVGSVILQFYIPKANETIHNLDQVIGLDITVFSDCVNTISYLKSLAE